MATYKVGQAPWETTATAATPSFSVGQAPWETGTPEVNKIPKPFTIFGSPSQDIRGAGADVYNAITGQAQYAGKNPIERGFSAASSAATAIPSVAADVIPGGKAALGLIGGAFSAATEFAGNIHNTLADLAQKVGIMTPEQRKQYDTNNTTFANFPIGKAIDSAASVGNSTGNIANVILMAHATAQAVQKMADNTPKVAEKIKTTYDDAKQARQSAQVQGYANEIANIENRYVRGRNANDYSTDGGNSSRQRIAQSNVLRNSVDENGLLRTTQNGGAVEQYRAMTVKPAEGVVRDLLVKEGGRTNVSDIKAALIKELDNSSLTGADLVRARSQVNAEIAGLRLEADPLGNVPNEILQDAKINQTNNINYQTPPEVSTVRKAFARAYKGLIEQNTHTFDVRAINGELSKFYGDISRLESMDGMRVQGGRLGKYSAQIAGNIIGGALGSMFGPMGAATGAALGGELSGAIKGASMSKTFGDTGTTLPESQILQKAVQQAKAP